MFAIPCEKKFQLKQHIATSLHRRSKVSNNNNNENANTSSNISSNFSDNSNNEFKMDLCAALVAGNIPWNVLNNATFNNFLKKYTGQLIPDESTLRKSYLDKCYQQSIQKIRDSIKGESVWISVDETTDKQGRYVANLIVGTLSENESSCSFLLSCKQLEEVNNATVSRFVNDSIRILWPHGNESKVLLLLTDAAAYMIKADAPVILTLPHMLGASNEYTKMIRGLKPDAQKHQTYVDVQHLTGTPLQGGKRVQFNMFLKSINRISLTENLTTVLMPAIWVEEGIQLNNEMVAFFKKRLINTLKTLNVVHWASLCGGIGVAAMCLIYYVVHRRKPAVVVEAPLK